jgi:predicted PurR-regulated permease PerM
MASDSPSGVVPAVAARAASQPERSVLAPDVDPAASTPAQPNAPAPDLKRTGTAIAQPASRSAGVTILAVLALLYTLYFARAFLVPIVFAVLLNFLLSPAIRALARMHVRPPLGAALVVAALVTALGAGAYALSGPAQRWIANVPQSIAGAESKLRHLVRPVQQVTQTAEQVERAAGAVGGRAAKEPEVVVRTGPTLASRVFGTTERLAAGLLEVVILLYFLLAGGDLFLQKLIKVLPHFGDKVKAVEIARATEAAVSAYLSTATLISVTEGVVVAVVLWMIGLPNAPLFGAIVALLEFVPYLGAATAVVVLGVAGLAAFDNVGQALLAPASYLAINLVQANLVTPLLLGHRLTLNPVAIFVGLAFFFWIWGVPGAFLAVPVLATFKIFCDHIAALAAIGEFLGQRDESERRVVVRAEGAAPPIRT